MSVYFILTSLIAVSLSGNLQETYSNVDALLENNIVLCTGPSFGKKDQLIQITQRDAQLIPFKKIFVATNDFNNIDVIFNDKKPIIRLFQNRGKQLDCLNCIIISIRMATNDPEINDDDIILFKHESVYINDMNLVRQALNKINEGYEIVIKYWLGLGLQTSSGYNDYYHTDSFFIKVSAARKLFKDHPEIIHFTYDYQFCEEYFSKYIVNKLSKVYKINYHHSNWKDNELGFYHIPRYEEPTDWYWDKKNYNELYDDQLPLPQPRCTITYDFSGGRLGDNLLSYCHAKWLSHQYNIPFLYRPFAYSDHLAMHTQEKWLTEAIYHSFDVVIILTPQIHMDLNKNILYVVPYFSESIVERQGCRFPYLFSVDWNNSEFQNEIRKMICPLSTLTYPKINTQAISVALHVRVGTGFDIKGLTDYTWIMKEKGVELKFPPFSFYIKALEKILDAYPDQIIYVYLFTDHDKPEELVTLFKKELLSERIIFDYKKEGNRHDQNVLEDFFSLTQFDCLIRSDSNFSFIASQLADYEMQLSPWHIHSNSNEYYVDQILINNKVYAI